VHRTLRWLGVPLALTAPFALATIWQSAGLTLLDGIGFCRESPAAAWEQAWPPLQLLIVVAAAVRIGQHWRAQGMPST
jgi:hypothetical protein